MPPMLLYHDSECGFAVSPRTSAMGSAVRVIPEPIQYLHYML